MWKRILTPGWVIAAILVALFSYFAFTFLAPWQLGKHERLVQRNDHISEAFDRDPVPYTNIAPDGDLNPDNEWTRVTMTGHYDAADEVLLRLRPVDNTPAFQVLTPFVIDGGPTFLVNRGWVPADHGGTTVPDFPAPPEATTTIMGMMRLDEGPSGQEPLNDQGHEMIYSISTQQAADVTGTQLAPSYLQLAAGQPGELTAIPLPQLETGVNLSYGLQWIAFGIMAPAGLIYFIVADARERRRFKEEQDEMAPATPVATGPEPPKAGATARTRYSEAKRNPWASAYDREEER